MSKHFEVSREVELPATPSQVFTAVTTGTEAWLFPSGAITDPQVGATTGDGATIVAWDPPHHFHVRTEGEDGWFNALEFLIEGRDGGSAVLRYVHSGIVVEGWEDQYDGISAHTDFYLHTLGEYLRHFDGRPVTYVGGEGSAGVQGPASSSTVGSLARARSALGLDGATVGDTVRLQVAGLIDEDAVVDYLSQHFIGLRTSDSLVRVFGRETWNGPVAASIHAFRDGVDVPSAEKAVQGWLESLFA